MNRAQQNERNRALVLSAARRVFLARGYHAATLDEIADEAGFSKGVVYSQFQGKADLFMALLEARIEERAEENTKLAADMAYGGGLPVLLDHLARADNATPGWLLLVIEFRVHAARDIELSRRYAAAHARTVEALTGVLTAIEKRTDEEFALAPHRLAEVMLAISAGAALEQAANPVSFDGQQLARLFAGLLQPAAPMSPAGAPTGSSRP
ncbi:MAG: TetR/AcrR family transcriptional regulator [Candidatus Dormibacteraeota bacterium]|nr:TetR/AcrR family transcriptional regulator [Candidatus Dormibacteraeota bacterium]